jgi:hypothetical protein
MRRPGTEYLGNPRRRSSAVKSEIPGKKAERDEE